MPNAQTNASYRILFSIYYLLYYYHYGIGKKTAKNRKIRGRIWMRNRTGKIMSFIIKVPCHSLILFHFIHFFFIYLFIQLTIVSLNCSNISLPSTNLPVDKSHITLSQSCGLDFFDSNKVSARSYDVNAFL